MRGAVILIMDQSKVELQCRVVLTPTVSQDHWWLLKVDCTKTPPMTHWSFLPMPVSILVRELGRGRG